MNLIRNKIKFPPRKNSKQIINYFKKHKIWHYLKSPIIKKRDIKKLVNPWTDRTYLPELKDLYLLHSFILLNKRLTVLEFGSGWSSLIMAHALMINKKKYEKKTYKIRKKNIFELHVLENEKKYLKITKNRNEKILKKFKGVKYHFSDCKMSLFNNKFCTEYKKLPVINPDFIYLDGPDQFKIKNKLNNFTISHSDMMPMVSDILKFEYYLVPGTIIVSDGRRANSLFLKNNFQRNWLYFYDKINDQNIFFLNDSSLGPINDEMLKFYRNKS